MAYPVSAFIYFHNVCIGDIHLSETLKKKNFNKLKKGPERSSQEATHDHKKKALPHVFRLNMAPFWAHSFWTG